MTPRPTLRHPNAVPARYLMAGPRYHRTPGEVAEEPAVTVPAVSVPLVSVPLVSVPVVLPLVVFTVHLDGTMTLTVDGALHEPAQFAPPWKRDAFPTVLDVLTAEHRVPLRVEVHEADGSTFTDIIIPARTHPHPPALTRPDAAAASDEASNIPGAPSACFTTGGSEFAPGEDVALAIIISHSDAAGDGSVRGTLTRELSELSPTREVVLFGRISGTVSVGQPE
jgi:hypothetical protein